jgi:hypothetical protein
VSSRSDPQGYYRALGVPHTASAEDIRLAFRGRAMASHPDQAGANGNGETFRLVREAYEVLRDPRRRMAYDASGLAAWERAPAPGGDWGDGFAERRSGPGSGTRRGPAPASEPPAAPASAAPESDDAPKQDRSARAGNGAAHDSAFATAGRPTSRPRRRKAARLVGSRLWPLVAAGLALLLLVVLGSLWSAHRQLGDRQRVVGDLYERLSRLGAEQAELRSRYRSVAFLDLERALRLGRGGAGVPVLADSARAVDRFDIAFADGGIDLGPAEAQSLSLALVGLAGAIDRLPAEAEWLIVIEAQAARAALADQVAVESWEPALLRLATVLDALLVQGLPGGRLAIRFNAGFAAPALPTEPSIADGALEPGVFDRVSIQLLCCVD